MRFQPESCRIRDWLRDECARGFVAAHTAFLSNLGNRPWFNSFIWKPGCASWNLSNPGWIKKFLALLPPQWHCKKNRQGRKRSKALAVGRDATIPFQSSGWTDSPKIAFEWPARSPEYEMVKLRIADLWLSASRGCYEFRWIKPASCLTWKQKEPNPESAADEARCGGLAPWDLPGSNVICD